MWSHAQSYIAPETALSSAYHTGFTFEFGKLILFSFIISDYVVTD